MSNQGTIRRYTLIIEKIKSRINPSFNLLRDFLLEHGFEISNRTLQRDIEQIRIEFGVEIKYDRSRNGYYIDEEESINLDSFLKFLEIVATANLLSQTLKDGKEALKFISFESEGNLKGIENLQAILFATKNRRIVSFTHFSYTSEKETEYQVNPYLLKEYQNRWYLFGFVDGINEFRTFGIDRIENLSVKTKTFKPESKINPQQYFENVVGLNYSLNKPIEILLSFTPLQGKYIKTLPLHHSQKIIKETAKEVHATLFITPNYEFLQKLLMLGDNVKILKPKELVSEMKSALKSALKQYS